MPSSKDGDGDGDVEMADSPQADPPSIPKLSPVPPPEPPSPPSSPPPEAAPEPPAPAGPSFTLRPVRDFVPAPEPPPAAPSSFVAAEYDSQYASDSDYDDYDYYSDEDYGYYYSDDDYYESDDDDGQWAPPMDFGKASISGASSAQPNDSNVPGPAAASTSATQSRTTSIIPIDVQRQTHPTAPSTSYASQPSAQSQPQLNAQGVPETFICTKCDHAPFRRKPDLRRHANYYCPSLVADPNPADDPANKPPRRKRTKVSHDDRDSSSPPPDESTNPEQQDASKPSSYYRTPYQPASRTESGTYYREHYYPTRSQLQQPNQLTSHHQNTNAQNVQFLPQPSHPYMAQPVVVATSSRPTPTTTPNTTTTTPNTIPYQAPNATASQTATAPSTKTKDYTYRCEFCGAQYDNALDNLQWHWEKCAIRLSLGRPVPKVYVDKEPILKIGPGGKLMVGMMGRGAMGVGTGPSAMATRNVAKSSVSTTTANKDAVPSGTGTGIWVRPPPSGTTVLNATPPAATGSVTAKANGMTTRSSNKDKGSTEAIGKDQGKGQTETTEKAKQNEKEKEVVTKKPDSKGKEKESAKAKGKGKEKAEVKKGKKSKRLSITKKKRKVPVHRKHGSSEAGSNHADGDVDMDEGETEVETASDDELESEDEEEDEEEDEIQEEEATVDHAVSNSMETDEPEVPHVEVDNQSGPPAQEGNEAAGHESDGSDSDVVLIERPAEFKSSTRRSSRAKNAPFVFLSDKLQYPYSYSAASRPPLNAAGHPYAYPYTYGAPIPASAQYPYPQLYPNQHPQYQPYVYPPPQPPAQAHAQAQAQAPAPAPTPAQPRATRATGAKADVPAPPTPATATAPPPTPPVSSPPVTTQTEPEPPRPRLRPRPRPSARRLSADSNSADSGADVVEPQRRSPSAHSPGDLGGMMSVLVPQNTGGMVSVPQPVNGSMVIDDDVMDRLQDPNATPAFHAQSHNEAFVAPQYHNTPYSNEDGPIGQEFLMYQPTAKKRKRGQDKERPDGYIKRPANSFILFRKDFMQGEYARMSREEKALVQEMQIHTVISEKWRALTPSERAFWDAKAAEAKAEHMRNNPEYRYQPTKKPAGSKGATAVNAAPGEPGNYYRDRSSSQNLNLDDLAGGSPSSPSTPEPEGPPPELIIQPYITIPVPKPIRPRRKTEPKRPVGRTADYESVMDMVVPAPPPRILAKDWVAAQVALKAEKEREREARAAAGGDMAVDSEPVSKQPTPSVPSPAPMVIPPPPPPPPQYQHPSTPPMAAAVVARAQSKEYSPSMETSFQQMTLDNAPPNEPERGSWTSPHHEKTPSKATSTSPATQRPEQNGMNAHASLGSPAPGPDAAPKDDTNGNIVAAPRPLHANAPERGGPLLFGNMEPLPPIRPDPTPPLFGVIDCSDKAGKRKTPAGSVPKYARDSVMSGTEGADVPESDELHSDDEGPESEDGEVDELMEREKERPQADVDADMRMVNWKSQEVETAEKQLREVLPVGVDTTSKISLLTSTRDYIESLMSQVKRLQAERDKDKNWTESLQSKFEGMKNVHADLEKQLVEAEGEKAASN